MSIQNCKLVSTLIEANIWLERAKLEEKAKITFCTEYQSLVRSHIYIILGNTIRYCICSQYCQLIRIESDIKTLLSGPTNFFVYHKRLLYLHFGNFKFLNFWRIIQSLTRPEITIIKDKSFICFQFWKRYNKLVVNTSTYYSIINIYDKGWHKDSGC